MKVLKQITGPLRENCYIIYSENGNAVMIDPGADAELLIEKVKELNLTVKALLITHTHYDHIGAVDVLRAAFDVKSYVPKGEKDLIEDGQGNLSAIYAGTIIKAKVDEVVDGGEILDFGDGLCFKTLLVPGHSQYSICYYMENEDNSNWVFTGDTLFRQSVGRVDLYDGLPTDLVNNIKAKLLPLPDDTIVYAGHGLSTTIGAEKKNNPFLKENGYWY